MIIALVIFLVTCLLIGLRQIPQVHINRRVGRLVGAVLMVVFSVLTLEQVFANTADTGKPVRITVNSADTKSGRTYRIALVCDTVQKRIQGLQGFRRLRRDEAALFVFEKPELATFWMGTVEYAIDIVFVDLQGKVVRVFSDCRPRSRDLFASGVPVKWVIETRAGSGIREGERVLIK